jgi:integration host factor subunit alpha
MTISKAHLTDSIHKALGLSKSESYELVGSLFETMKATLENGDDILIRGFGKFCLKKNNGRRNRNPLTDQNMMLEANRVVTFKCSMPLRNKLNGEG